MCSRGSRCFTPGYNDNAPSGADDSLLEGAGVWVDNYTDCGIAWQLHFRTPPPLEGNLRNVGSGTVSKKFYRTIDEMSDKKHNCLILGVTGGIACGKSTVAHMLAELGAHVIDFDVLARQVVEPGKPALQKIADYFGTDLIGKDGQLDRKKLSVIVFRNPEKLRKLESFTHPAINEEYFRQVSGIAEKSPATVLLAVIPLLFEFDLGHMVDKILVVYIPRKEQIKRLTRRDCISEEAAGDILRAQIPIDEKLRQADFVIRNENSPEDTRKQVMELWHKLTSGIPVPVD